MSTRAQERFAKACSKSWKKAQKLIVSDVTYSLLWTHGKIWRGGAMLSAIRGRRIDSVKALFAIHGEQWDDCENHLFHALMRPLRAYGGAWKPSPELKEIIKELIKHTSRIHILHIFHRIMRQFNILEFHEESAVFFLREAKISLAEYEIPQMKNFDGHHNEFSNWQIKLYNAINEYKCMCMSARTFDLVLMLCDDYFIIAHIK